MRSGRGGWSICFFFFQAEVGIRGRTVTGVQTCALPIWVVCCGDGGLAGQSLGCARGKRLDNRPPARRLVVADEAGRVGRVGPVDPRQDVELNVRAAVEVVDRYEFVARRTLRHAARGLPRTKSVALLQLDVLARVSVRREPDRRPVQERVAARRVLLVERGDVGEVVLAWVLVARGIRTGRVLLLPRSERVVAIGVELVGHVNE